MKRKAFPKWFWLFLVVLFLLPLSNLAAKKEKWLWSERETLYFSLPSTPGSADQLSDEYYGKYHLDHHLLPGCLHPCLNGRDGGSSEESLPL